MAGQNVKVFAHVEHRTFPDSSELLDESPTRDLEVHLLEPPVSSRRHRQSP